MAACAGDGCPRKKTMRQLRLLCVLAHPDDETLGTGGVLARYSRSGIKTFLVTATRGENGRYDLGERHPGPETLGKIREAELKQAAKILGISEVTLLDYPDGGFDRAEPGEVVRKIVYHIRRIRPDIVVTFGPDGAYGHPDHIAVSQFTVAALAAAADAGFDLDGEFPAHLASKLYFIAWSTGKWVEYQAALKNLSVRVNGFKRQAVPWPDWGITTRVDCTEHWSTVRNAVFSHQTQVRGYGRLAELPDEEHRKLWGSQEFYRVFSLVNGGRQVETDLFEGLNSSEAPQEIAGRELFPSSTRFHPAEGEGPARSSPLDMTSARFRCLGHILIDRVADFLDTLPSRRVTVPNSPSDIRRILEESEAIGKSDTPADELLPWVADKLFDHSLHNGHPRFWGYITSSAAPIGMLGDLLAAAVNPNVGAWKLSSFASEMEADVVRQIAGLLGYPAECGGLLVSGGNMANFVGFLVARRAQLGSKSRTRGIGILDSRLRVYVSKETHTWIQKAADMAGLGTDSIRWIETDDAGRMDAAALERQIELDLAQGDRPFLVVGSAGTVSTGAIDPLPVLSGICRKHGLWFHVDGAYGAPAALVPGVPPDLSFLRLADSVAVDPHKWMYAPLEAGCILVSNREALTKTFSYHPPYYNFDKEQTNYFDLGPQNSRGFRALKVWLVLRSAGSDGLRRMIGEDIRLAAKLVDLLKDSKELEPLTQCLSITTFRYVPERLRGDASIKAGEYLDSLNRALLERLEQSGEVFLSNAIVKGKFALRLCIVNFRTTLSDIVALVEVVTRFGKAVDSELMACSRTA